MKTAAAIEFLQDNHLGKWLSARQAAEQELSDKHQLFCVCGKLATGLHMGGCRKFHKEVNNATLEKLTELLNK